MDTIEDVMLDEEDLAAYEFMPKDAYGLIEWLDRLYPPRPMTLAQLRKLTPEQIDHELREEGIRQMIDMLKDKRDEEIGIAARARSITGQRN